MLLEGITICRGKKKTFIKKIVQFTSRLPEKKKN